MRTLTIISPVFNEAEGIAAFHEALSCELTNLRDRYVCTVLYVVDRCSDGTLDVLEGICARDPSTRVLGFSSRFGHQQSLLAGMDYADSDAVIMLDSDLQHPPSLIPVLLERYEAGYDIVQTVREDTQQISGVKKFFSEVFYKVLNHLSPVKFESNAADFRLLSRRVVEVFQSSIRERNMFLRGLVNWVGFNRTSVRYVAPPRQFGSSKFSYLSLMSFAASGIVSFSKKPLHICFILGVLFASLGCLHAMLVLVKYLVDSSSPPGWLTLVVLITFFSGIQLIFLGVIGAYVGATFDEVKARPHYIVERAINFPPR